MDKILFKNNITSIDVYNDPDLIKIHLTDMSMVTAKYFGKDFKKSLDQLFLRVNNNIFQAIELPKEEWMFTRQKQGIISITNNLDMRRLIHNSVDEEIKKKIDSIVKWELYRLEKENKD